VTEEMLRPFVPAGGTAVDVGANVGEVTGVLLDLVGEKGTVYAVEPGPKVYEILARKLAGDMRVTLMKVAFSDERTVKRVFHHYDWTLLDEDDPRRADNVFPPSSYPHLKEASPFQVMVAPMDDFFFSLLGAFYEHRKIHFIKIDVDGWEAKVIRGGLRTIAKYRPTMLVEIGKYTLEKVGDDVLSLARPLYEMGYIPRNFATGERYETIEALRAAVPADMRTIDVVFQ
jgi:FkbM family methyltransferase